MKSKNPRLSAAEDKRYAAEAYATVTAAHAKAAVMTVHDTKVTKAEVDKARAIYVKANDRASIEGARDLATGLEAADEAWRKYHKLKEAFEMEAAHRKFEDVLVDHADDAAAQYRKLKRK